MVLNPGPTTNLSICAQWDLTAPKLPSSVGYCATYTYGSLTDILRSCCNNALTTNYTGKDPTAPTNCFQYCNVTEANVTPTMVSQCVIRQAMASNMGHVQTIIGGGSTANDGSLFSGADRTLNLKSVRGLAKGSLIGMFVVGMLFGHLG